MKIEDVIKRIEKKHGILPLELTCDRIIYGDAKQECSGIVLTCNPSADVIRKAAEIGYNLIIGHEPTFYHGYDGSPELCAIDISQKKEELLRENGIVVYRDHDQVHSEKTDMVYDGIVKMLGWESYGISAMSLS